MPVLQLNGQTLQLNGQDLYLNGVDDPEEPVPAPEPVKGNRGKGKKQQIYSQGPWAYR
jgi:hypothetical protein